MTRIAELTRDWTGKTVICLQTEMLVGGAAVNPAVGDEYTVTFDYGEDIFRISLKECYTPARYSKLLFKLKD